MSGLFILQMAWRDSRASRRRLLLFALCISVGVAALVTLDSFRASLAEAINGQARTLLGADLVVETNRPFTPSEETQFAEFGPRQARETRFTSMLVFPRGAGTRLVQVRGLEGDFPFYGEMETRPPGSLSLLRGGGRILVDQSLLFQFGTKIGDRVRLGEAEFEVAGALLRIPGDASAGAGFAPRVFLAASDVAATRLVQPGSLVRYLAYIGFAGGVNAEARAAELELRLQAQGFEVDTVAERQRAIGRALENVYRFLSLIGFVSLLLGALGVASGISMHLRQKTRTSAILRCLGATRLTTLAVYLLQAAGIGVAGALVGGLLGLAAQQVLPVAARSFLPVEISSRVMLWPVARGAFIGFAFCLLFSLPPLLRFRRVAPLQALRRAGDGGAARDPAIWAAWLCLAGAVTLFSISQAQTVWQGLIYAGALALVLGLLSGWARLLIGFARRLISPRAPYVLRQGLSNLYRPHNRTLLLTVSLGLATFLLVSLQLTRDVLLAQFQSIDDRGQPNIFLFDIQPDQKEPVGTLVRELEFPVLQEAPIVTMRLSSIKGRPVSEILADPARKIPEWQLEREYRSTFRDHLTGTEKITAGAWIGRVTYQAGDVVPISLDRELARDWNAAVGDELVFDVQGVPVRTRIASLREIDWRRFQTNFFVVFPAGVLESAPGFHVLVSRVPDAAASARLQGAVVARFPNVSAIDLAAVIRTVDSILSKVAMAVRVVSLFTVIAGLAVAASVLWSGRYQRVEESVLLRTLGATRRQIWLILAAEYLFLGLFAGLAGVGLAAVASWGLAFFVFELTYAPSALVLGVGGAVATLLTVGVGLLASRGVGNVPPLVILRAESA